MSSMSAITTFMPRRASCLAVANPMPDAPPVMKAVRPEKSLIVVLPLVQRIVTTASDSSV
jgi:hypothetical protein